MRVVRYENDAGQILIGECEREGLAFGLEGGPFEWTRVNRAASRVTRLLAPVEPPNVWAIGRNYPEHAREMSAAETLAEPLVFGKPTTAVIGPNEPIVLPRSASEQVDYEGELAVVIGRRCRDVPPGEAERFIFGYTCANDVTARDCQRTRDKQWSRAKGFDTFCPLGPAIVTADQFDPAQARVRTYLNDRLMQDGAVADMIYPIAELVSWLSRQFTLLPGTVLLTGTPPGVGAARTPPVFLRAGDRVVVEIEGIGRLENPVVAAT